MLSSLWTAAGAKLHRTRRPNISLPYSYGDRDAIDWRRRYCIGCIITTALTSAFGTLLPCVGPDHGWAFFRRICFIVPARDAIVDAGRAIERP
jgi:hypothetical protein